MIKKFVDFKPSVDSSCYIADSSVVIGKVEIGKDSSVWECTVIRGDVDKIKIGNGTNIQDNSVLHVHWGLSLTIGDNVTVGHNVNLHGCSIGNNTLIGIGAIILNGAKIGNNCIVGAGSVVTQYTEIPDNSLVIGSPAKIIRTINENDVEEIIKNAKDYVKLSKQYIGN